MIYDICGTVPPFQNPEIPIDCTGYWAISRKSHQWSKPPANLWLIGYPERTNETWTILTQVDPESELQLALFSRQDLLLMWKETTCTGRTKMNRVSVLGCSRTFSMMGTNIATWQIYTPATRSNIATGIVHWVRSFTLWHVVVFQRYVGLREGKLRNGLSWLEFIALSWLWLHGRWVSSA